MDGPNDNDHFFFSSISLIKGMSIVHAIENSSTGANDRPKSDVVIADCGIIDVPEKIAVDRKGVDPKI